MLIIDLLRKQRALQIELAMEKNPVGQNYQVLKNQIDTLTIMIHHHIN